MWSDPVEVEAIISCMQIRRDSMSCKAARCIRGFQNEVGLSYAKGWHDAMDAVTKKLAEEMKV